MLGRQNDPYPLAVAKAFEKELDKVKVWAEREPHVEILRISYADTIENPEHTIRKVNDFLGGWLSENEMIRAIDSSLYRNKSK